MRTTLTIDDDVAAKLKAEVRRTGKALKAVVNESLRSGLLRRQQRKAREPFRVRTRNLGALGPGVSLENIGELVELVDGPERR
jgi:hypothetical protein